MEFTKFTVLVPLAFDNHITPAQKCKFLDVAAKWITLWTENDIGY